MAVKAVLSEVEYDQLPDDGNRYELLDGELLTMPPPPFRRRKLQSKLAHLLENAASAQRLSAIVEAPVRFSPKLTLVPDIALVSDQQMSQVGSHGYLGVAPLVVIEVVSESNKAREIARKVEVFLTHGSREVWVIYPEERLIWVHTPDGVARQLKTHLESAALPGWRMPLDEAWAAVT